MKTATLKFIGTQPGFGRVAGFDMYNVLALSEPHEKLPIGTTTTLATVEKLGYEVALQEESSGVKVKAIVTNPMDISDALLYTQQARGQGLNHAICVEDADDSWLVCSNRELTEDQANAIIDEDSENEFPRTQPHEYEV